jgi:hypothetical protein
VLILEKAPEGEEGGNTRVSGNLFFNPEPVDKAKIYFNAMSSGYRIPDDVLQIWAEEMGANDEWIESFGADLFESPISNPEYPELPGADCCHVYSVTPDVSDGLWQLLKDQVGRRSIQVLYGTPVKKLIQNALDKSILGVVAEDGGGMLNIKAKRAVIMTCGGFENNNEMMRDFLANVERFPVGTPYNTGDGIKMVIEAGADLWHLSAQSGMRPAFHFPDTDVSIFLGGTPTGEASTLSKFIWVDGSGKRYIDEGISNRHGYVLLNSVWRPFPQPIPAFQIFDEECIKTGPLISTTPYGWYKRVLGITWSSDNSAEVSKGWIIRADTISELAGKLGIPATTLETTVSNYNNYCSTGVDAEFGRKPGKMLPIERPPFYGMPIVGGILNTQGGARRNAKAQVVQPDYSPIPRLYSAGEFGSVYGFLYNGGGNVGECLAFGRIAGRNAATETPWG